MKIFDKMIKRTNTLSYKWDDSKYCDQDLLQMWVADMDFAVPNVLQKAFRERIRHGILGYTCPSQEFTKTLAKYIGKNYGYVAKEEWLTICPPGVIPAIAILLDVLTTVDDNVFVHTPNYGSLISVVTDRGRRLITDSLILVDGTWQINFEEMQRLFAIFRPKVYLMSSPHNPCGRVWDKHETQKIVDICRQYDTVIISDEVHCDIVFFANKFFSMSRYCEEINVISMFSPNKTFNVGGLMTANIVIPDENTRTEFNRHLSAWQMTLNNTFGQIANEVLYKSASAHSWKKNLIHYLQNNVNWASAYVNNHLNPITTSKPQGTYFLWLDCSRLKYRGNDLVEFFVTNAKVRLSCGLDFGQEYGHFLRINLACPHQQIVTALTKMKTALEMENV